MPKDKNIGLIIGCNYNGTNHKLNGCINDTKLLKNTIPRKMGISSKNLYIMTDYSKDNMYPTRDNIISELNNIITRINNEHINEFWFSFSGHGSYITDRNNDERDGRDECIIPLRYKKGIISDDDLLKIFSKISYPNCKVICLFDCCHSGTIMDLEYNYKRLYHKSIWRRAWVKVRYSWILSRKKTKPYWKWHVSKDSVKNTLKCQVVCISGCFDNSTSADVYWNKKKEWGGALTNGFISLVNDDLNNLSCLDICDGLNKYMKKIGQSQKPVISSNYPINKNTKLLNV